MKCVNVMISKVLGGVEQAFLDYNMAMALTGNEVYAIFNKKNTSISEKIKTTKDVHCISSYFLKPYFFMFFNYLIKLKKIKPDIVIVHSKKVLPLFALIGKIMKVPVVVVCHNEKTKIIKCADYIFSITQYQKNIFTKAGFDKRKIFVIPNMTQCRKDYKEFMDFSEPPIFGIAGRFEPAKG